MSAITITLGDQAENHKGMQLIGAPAEKGFSVGDLSQISNNFTQQGCKCETINLNTFLPTEVEAEPAAVLVIRQGINCLLSNTPSHSQDLFQELRHLDWDEKAFMYGRVVNKHARHNLCFADEDQEPDYEAGKGRVVSWKTVPLLKEIRERMKEFIKDSEELRAGEGNYYYDVSKCGIGFHGDAERKRVVALRLAEVYCPPIQFQWFQKGEQIGKRAIIELMHGDIYVMSEKAVGWDWKKKILPTLRHASGCDKFTKF